MKHIEIIVPCYNEEACIRLLYDAVEKVFRENKDYRWSLLYVNDGSRDGTLAELKKLREAEPEHVEFISFARNFGKESAIYAGLENSRGDLVVLMDADLQHPPEMLPEMIKGIEEGFDCCGARRVSRKGEPILRSAFSRMFYGFINRVTDMELVQGGSDYRVMSRQMVNAMLQLSERERFTKGIMSWVGFETKWIPYENVKRAAGKSKWSFFGLVRYAANGFMAFATTPLRAVVWLGILIVAFSLAFAIWTVVDALRHPESIGSGYATIVILISFFSGVIITILGVIGEYMARIYVELKHRPIYIEKLNTIKQEKNEASES
ncbi:MAG: glycosyltransferase family 2 protein [Lachnospiraceae bacterium]|nr:glycosyltransferase family 2 protein [Lachnospiraceae bacterium]